jgi:phage shock protein PspC (stress-responsive transcriptional regulator)
MGGLVREPDDRKIAGVCSGLADRLGVDVTAVRLGVVALALVTPTVVIAYVVAALVVPERRPDQVRVRAQRVHLGRIPHPVLVIGAIVAVALVVDDAWWLEPFPAALALIAVGVWLIAQGHDGGNNLDDGLPWPGATAPDGAASPPSDAEGVDGTALASAPLGTDPTLFDATAPFAHAEGTGPSGEVPPPAPSWWSGGPGVGVRAAPVPPAAGAPPIAAPAPTPATPRAPRSRLATVVLAVLLVGGGVAWLLDVVDLVDLDWTDRLALGLVVVGVGLLIAAWRGRAWVLVPVGLLFVLLIVVAEALVVPVDAGMGEQTEVIDTPAELARDHELFAGQLTLDLRDVPVPAGETATVEASVGAGQMRVLVPDDATVTVDADVRIGEVVSDGGPDANESGVGLDERFTLAGAARGPELDLDLFVGFGSLEVTRG